MPDITMCQSVHCAKRDECYRFTATPNPWRQSYFSIPPLVDGKCNSFTSNHTTTTPKITTKPTK